MRLVQNLYDLQVAVRRDPVKDVPVRRAPLAAVPEQPSHHVRVAVLTGASGCRIQESMGWAEQVSTAGIIIEVRKMGGQNARNAKNKDTSLSVVYAVMPCFTPSSVYVIQSPNRANLTLPCTTSGYVVFARYFTLTAH